MGHEYLETPPEDVMLNTLYIITGQRYSFASSSCRRWGADGEVENDYGIGFFQLMPDDTDDGFFDFYCDRRMEHQFYRTREDCVLNFLGEWATWKTNQLCRETILPKEHY